MAAACSRRQRLAWCAAFLGAAWWLALPAAADDIVVMTSGAFTAPFQDAAPWFERRTGHDVVAVFGASTGGAPDSLPARLARGERADIVIASAQAIDALIAAGEVEPGSRRDLVLSRIGVAVRAGAPKPDIRSTDALKKTLLAAKSIGYSTGPSGVYVTGLFQRLGVADEIKGRLKQTPTGVFVGSIIASGEAEIGFQQISELSHFAGVDYVGPLPADVQQFTMFSSGIIVGAKDADGAKALVKFITAPAAAAAFKNRGMEPG